MQETVGSGAHVLVADDDRLVLATLSTGLRKAGYQVSAAASGEEAMRLAANRAPDVLLLDVRMPDLSGLEVARRLQQRGNLPVVFLSAHGDADIVKHATEFGAMGYLVKPADTAQIVPQIEAALARGKELSRLRETEGQLHAALSETRETSMAVGVIMERNHLDRRRAFDLLRDYARSRQRKIGEVAEELLEALETLNLSFREKRPRKSPEV